MVFQSLDSDIVLHAAPGKGYNVFAGRDASKALGKSSMKPEDLSADYSDLTEWELKVLDDWLAYYTKVWCRTRFYLSVHLSCVTSPSLYYCQYSAFYRANLQRYDIVGHVSDGPQISRM